MWIISKKLFAISWNLQAFKQKKLCKKYNFRKYPVKKIGNKNLGLKVKFNVAFINFSDVNNKMKQIWLRKLP